MRKLEIDLDELVAEATWNDHLEVGPLRFFDRETGNIVFVDRKLSRSAASRMHFATTPKSKNSILNTKQIATANG